MKPCTVRRAIIVVEMSTCALVMLMDVMECCEVKGRDYDTK